jgi:hypothetical protein
MCKAWGRIGIRICIGSKIGKSDPDPDRHQTMSIHNTVLNVMYLISASKKILGETGSTKCSTVFSSRGSQIRNKKVVS